MNQQKTIVVALGGNAISRENEEGNITQQFANVRSSLKGVVDLLEQGYRVLLTHGNGPQAGNALIRVEETSKIIPTLPLGVIVADTEGGMGYMIEQCLQNKMRDRGFKREVATLVTQVLVDKNDPSIKDPTKFVGPFFNKEEAARMAETRNWIMKEDPGRGYRRVVPSPDPKSIISKKIVQRLLEEDVVVIAAGGGGVPVYLDSESGWLEGLDGVIDKDLASAVLGSEIGAETLLILTSVDKVALNFGKPNVQYLEHLTLAEARQYSAEGHFPAGSMGPKIAAAIRFLENGGKKVVITSIENSSEAVIGKAGTVISC